MKPNISAAFAAVVTFLTKSVATLPAPDPSHLEVALTVEESINANYPTLSPSDASSVQVIFFTQTTAGFTGQFTVAVSGRSVRVESEALQRSPYNSQFETYL